jgi:tRNA pseudouridine38-40 synthase
MRYRATLAYDGTAYEGFQRQAEGHPSVQGAVEAAIAAVTGQKVTVTGAGRTDTGVHATGQVIAFEVEWAHADDALLRALNVHLPPDIAVQDIVQADARFHPRFSATARLYRYEVYSAQHRHPLNRARAWHVWSALDGEAMQRAAALLPGTRDFGAFGKPPGSGAGYDETTLRTVYRSEWETTHAHLNGLLWTYHIEANAFLQHMVRRIVGMLVDVGRGAKTVEDFDGAMRRAVLVSKWTIAPPQGLTLVQVRYDERVETPAGE